MKKDTKSTKERQVKPNTAESESIQLISLEDLLPNPYQPASRIEVDPETAKKFGVSIQEHGLIQTPVARPGKDGKYEIGDGWLRRAGFLYNLQEVGLQACAKMPCVVRELSDLQMADMVMEANTIRKDLNPIELALFYKRYLEDFKMPQAELARRHNCSQGEIANTIRLLDLPADIQAKIISQEISETHGRQLLRLNYNPDLQQKVLKETIAQGSSVSDLSNSIAQKIYWSSENIDPKEYPTPPFDVGQCEKCPNRQKIGQPYGHEKKTWRCLDKACYKKKAEEADQQRIAKLTAEIQAAKEAQAEQPEIKGKGKGKDVVPVIDTKNLTWRDYQELDSPVHKIDNPGQCKTCLNRVIGSFYGGRTGPVCINVKCFKEKEKVYAAKEAAKTREAERQLTEEVKTICAKANDETVLCKVIGEHLLAHSRKDTRERFAKMYEIEMLNEEYFSSSDELDIVQKVAALVLQVERYEGEKGRFKKMLAELNGTGAEIEKQIAAFREKHCKDCRYDQDDDGCRSLIRVYLEGKCYLYWKKEKDHTTEPTEKTKKKPAKSEDEQIKDSLPCKDCQNATTCDRTFFYADGQGGLVCDNKVSAATREEVPDAV